MFERTYPTRKGIAISTHEIKLPYSELDLSEAHSYNNHHLEFTARNFGRFLISKTLRDLENMQESLPRDVHAELHKMYAPPEFPNPLQAMHRVGEAYENGELMKVWDSVQKRYVYQPITPIHFKQMEMELNRLVR